MIENAKKIKLGDQMDPATTMGPLISAKQKERVTGYIDSGKSDAKLVHSTEIPKGLERGHYV
ncbi:MAG: aldehyde dehydrogenase family protein, partial [Pseudolabrys sp.]